MHHTQTHTFCPTVSSFAHKHTHRPLCLTTFLQRAAMNLDQESESSCPGKEAFGSAPPIPNKVSPGWAGKPYTSLTSIHQPGGSAHPRSPSRALNPSASINQHSHRQTDTQSHNLRLHLTCPRSTGVKTRPNNHTTHTLARMRGQKEPLAVNWETMTSSGQLFKCDIFLLNELLTQI